MERSWKANLDRALRISVAGTPVQVLVVGQTRSNRSKTTPISSENVRPICRALTAEEARVRVQPPGPRPVALAFVPREAVVN
jgi:hypothetical protein